jgi:hypothetical protein
VIKKLLRVLYNRSLGLYSKPRSLFLFWSCFVIHPKPQNAFFTTPIMAPKIHDFVFPCRLNVEFITFKYPVPLLFHIGSIASTWERKSGIFACFNKIVPSNWVRCQYCIERSFRYTRKNLAFCSKSANKPWTSCVPTACLPLHNTTVHYVHCNLRRLGDTVSLFYFSGEMRGTLHRKVLEQQEIEIGPGCGLFLKQVYYVI